MSDYNYGLEDFDYEVVEPIESPNVPLNKSSQRSPYDLFREKVSSPVSEGELIRFPVEEREGMFVNFKKNIDFSRIELFLKQTTRGKRVNMLAFHTRLIGAMFHHFDVHGEPVEFDGRAIHINSQEFVDSCGVEGGSHEAMLHFFGKDSTIIALGNALIDAAGYTQELASEDLDEDSPR